MRFKQWLEEKRRNPDQNPKISIVKALEQWKDDPDVYISFTVVDKLGINPRSKYNTPLGIYTYPLKEIWPNMVSDTIPFMGDAPYVWAVRSKNKKFVKDMYKDYTSKDYDTDMLKISKIYAKTKELKDFAQDVNVYFDEHKSPTQVLHTHIEEWTRNAKDKNPVTAFWNVTREITQKSILNKPGTKPMVQWNKLLRLLGYSGFADKSGKGIIHIAEPTQAVFLSRDAFTVLGKFVNKRYKNEFEFIEKANTENAIYNIQKGRVVWEFGTWKSGVWTKGTWRDGVWKNGTWQNGIWGNGVWMNGVVSNYITWKKGTWKDGVWNDGDWESGTWKNGTWEHGYWQDGTWEHGLWKSGTWETGTWKDGVWKYGHWKNGDWMNGTWKGGYWEDGDWNNGVWENGDWGAGFWKNGTWMEGIWRDGTWEKGTWENGDWRDGTWKNGVWENGDWRDGTWKNGQWKGGIWYHGTWEKGEWKGGEWRGGYDADNNFHEEGDSPDKWS